MSFCLCLLKNTLFCTSFHLYPKRLSHFHAILERIPACQSTFLSEHTIRLLKIDSFNPSGIFNSSGASLGQFMHRYSLTNRAKEYEIILIILLTQ